MAINDAPQFVQTARSVVAWPHSGQIIVFPPSLIHLTVRPGLAIALLLPWRSGHCHSATVQPVCKSSDCASPICASTISQLYRLCHSEDSV